MLYCLCSYRGGVFLILMQKGASLMMTALVESTFQSFIGHSSSGVCAYSCVKQKRSVDGENGGGRCLTGGGGGQQMKRCNHCNPPPPH